MSFVSTAHAAVYNNAKPIFVDVDENTLCIDIDDVKRKITNKTSLVLPVHFGGYPCNVKRLHSITKNSNIKIIEDAAHACGSVFDGKKIGSHSELVCFSFHPVKNLSMPTGGAITINSDKKIEPILKSLRWCGITNRNESSYDVDKLGYNYYMNEVSAAIGLIQLQRLDKMNKKRFEIAKQYFKTINVEKKMPLSSDCSYHLYWIRVKNRDELMSKMRENGIETGIHYKPIHMMTFYKNSQKLETSERVWKELVSIPMHLNLSQSNIDKIIFCLNKYAKSTT
jgi:dTDP-4-amino-4,6-dideoxygalactose transaminase